jgi:hypothetical protein
MPLSDEEAQQGWIHSDQLPRIPPQELEGAEADVFLEWLFSGLARRPRPLSLRKGIAVARYVKLLAWEAPAGEMRRELAWLGDQVAKMVLDYAPYAAADKDSVVEFLEEHADTYLATIKARLGLDRCFPSRSSSGGNLSSSVRFSLSESPGSSTSSSAIASSVSSGTGSPGEIMPAGTFPVGEPHLSSSISEKFWCGGRPGE